MTTTGFPSIIHVTVAGGLGGTAGATTAAQVALNTSTFNNNFNSSITNVQLMANLLDDLIGGAVSSVNGFTGDVVLTATDIGAIDLAAIGAPNGVAGLDGNGFIDPFNIPPGIISEVSSVNGEIGDVQLNAEDIPLDTSAFTTPGDHVLDFTTVDLYQLALKVDGLTFDGSGAVDSVNGQIGTVHLTAANVGALDKILDAGAPGGFAPLNGSAIIPDLYLPTYVATVNGESGAVLLDSDEVPLITGGFTGLLLTAGATSVQDMADVVDALDFTGLGLVDSVNTKIGNVVLDAADVGAVDLTAVGAPDGVAPLDASGLLPSIYLPNIVGASIGLDTGPFTGFLDNTIINVQLLAERLDSIVFGPGVVNSVNGHVGTVIVVAADIPVDASGFSGYLNSGDTDLQLIADKLDQIPTVVGVNSVNGLDGDVQLNADDIPVNPTTFSGFLGPGITDVQLLAVRVDELPDVPIISVNGFTGIVVLGPDDVGAINALLYDAANGVCPLDGDALVPIANLPDMVFSINGTLIGDVVLDGTMVALDATNFVGQLTTSVVNVQLLAEAVDALVSFAPGVDSIQGLIGDVVLVAADVGAVDLTAVGAVNGVAPLDAAALVPTTNLPDVVFSVNSIGGIVQLNAENIPVDDSAFVGSLVGVTDVQGVADVLDTFTGSGGGHTIQEAGSPLTSRVGLNFLAGFDLTDNSGANSTDIALDLAEYSGAALSVAGGGSGATDAPGARTNFDVYSTAEVDAAVAAAAASIGKRQSVRAASPSNVTIATGLNNGDVVDGVTLATGNLVLLPNQTAPEQNGIYTVGVSPARSTGFTAYNDYPGALVAVSEGTTNGGSTWLCTSNAGGTIDVTAITFTKIGPTGTMASQNANNVAITGGTITGLSNFSMAAPIVSGPSATGVVNAASINLTSSMTLTQEPTDPSIGSPLFIQNDQILNFASLPNGPHGTSGYFGSRGVVEVEGTVQYNYSSTIFNPTPLTFGAFQTFTNNPGVAMGRTPGWSVVLANVHIADGAVQTLHPTEAAEGTAAIFDDTVFTTKNGGSFNGSGEWLISYISNPFVLGNTTFARRVGYYAREINQYPVDMQLVMDDLHGPGMDTNNYTVDEQVGFLTKRLTGATRNIGLRTDSSIELWADTNTFTSQPTDIIFISGNHTFNYTGGPLGGPHISGFDLGGIYQYSQIASGLGAMTGLNLHPIIKNTSTFAPGSPIIPLQFFASISPTYRADTQAITLTDITNLQSGSVFERVSGGTMTVANYTDIRLAPTVNTGVSVTNRYGVHVLDKTGSGGIGTQFGVFIDALTSTGPASYGLVNLNPSVLQGPIFGGFLSGQNLVLSSNGFKDGLIQLDNPQTELFVTDSTQTSVTNVLFVDAQITMGAGAPNNLVNGFSWTPTVVFSTEGGGGEFGAGAYMAHDRALYMNAAGSGARSLGAAIASFSANPKIRCNNPGGTSFVGTNFLVGFDSHPYLERRTSGTLLVESAAGIVSMQSGEAGTSCTLRQGLRVMDPDGAGFIQTNVGVDVLLQTKGVDNLGIRNASTTICPEQVSAITATTSRIRKDATVVQIANNTAGTITLSGAGQTIPDGYPNQILFIYNGGSQTVVLQDQSVHANSNLRIMANFGSTLAMGPRASAWFMYSATIADWVQITPICTPI